MPRRQKPGPNSEKFVSQSDYLQQRYEAAKAAPRQGSYYASSTQSQVDRIEEIWRE